MIEYVKQKEVFAACGGGKPLFFRDRYIYPVINLQPARHASAKDGGVKSPQGRIGDAMASPSA